MGTGAATDPGPVMEAFSERLSKLGADVQALETQVVPVEELLQKLRTPDPTAAASGSIPLDESDVMPVSELPNLTLADGAASGELSGVDFDDMDFENDDRPFYHGLHASSSDPSGGDETVLRSRLEEPAPAIDMQLPTGDALWDDADLERLVTAMDKHYGDVPAPVPELYAHLLDTDDGLLFPLDSIDDEEENAG